MRAEAIAYKHARLVVDSFLGFRIKDTLEPLQADV